MHTPALQFSPAPPQALNESLFSDIDEQAAALRGWNQRYLQLSCGKFSGAIQRLSLDGVGLFMEDLHQVVHQTGYVRPDVVALGVPLLLCGESQFCGQPGQESALYVFSGKDGFEFRSPMRHVMLGIEIDKHLFDAQVLGHDSDDSARIDTQATLHTAQGESTCALRRFLMDVFDAAAKHAWSAPAQQMRLRDELLSRVAACVAAPSEACETNTSKSPCATQTKLAQRALALVATRLDDPPTVAELCQHLGVSRRTLQNCFHATWGMGPLAWLNVLRLNVARSRLKTAQSVTEAATQLGFWHFGHFSHSYQSLFGELPSQTLRRHQGPRRLLSH
jgi:AraC family transcriptional regulator, ethanolamine operon transcriptional activator